MCDLGAARVLADDAAEAIAGHDRRVHGRTDFDPTRDVHIGGSDAPWQETRYTYDPKGHWYSCRDPACAYRRFYVSNPPEDPIVRVLRRSDPALAPFLAGAVTTAEMNRRVALADSGRFASELVALVARADQQKTRRPQPAAAARKERCQAFMLAHYAAHGRVEAAIDALSDLHRDDRDRYRQITGTDRLFAWETFRSYWRDIPADQRAAARRTFD
ncbi:MAG TPA: hypothetical protein VFW13_11705, partial [Phenylobacterium sp.]|nr:hypothetical protein [Phenylobacterium sp.]